MQNIIDALAKISVLVSKTILLSFALVLGPYYFIKFVPPLLPWYAYPWFIHDDHAESWLSIAYGFAVLVLLPFLQGVIVERESRQFYMSRFTRFSLLWLILIINLVLAHLIIQEGIICMIMASPLMLGVMGFGAAISNRLNIKNRILRVTMVPLIVAFVVYDTTKSEQPLQSYVEDSIVINVPPATVWKYLTTAPVDDSSPHYWLWQAGMPMPNQLALSKKDAGGTLEFRLSGGYKFVSQVTAIVPEKEISFAVNRQPDHPEIYGHISFDKGSFKLQDNGNNTTTLTATGWYSLLVQPTVYFDLWMRDIIHNVHQRVFNNIRRHAEADNI